MNTTPRKDSQAPTSFTSFALHNQVSMQEQPKIRPVTKHMGYFWKVVNLESYVRGSFDSCVLCNDGSAHVFQV